MAALHGQAKSGGHLGSPVPLKTVEGCEVFRTAMPGPSGSMLSEQHFLLPAASLLPQLREGRVGGGSCPLTGWAERELSIPLPSSVHPSSQLGLRPAQGEVVSIPKSDTIQPLQPGQGSSCLPLGRPKRKPGRTCSRPGVTEE